MIFVGVDWAEAHHDVHVEDAEGRRLGGGRLPEGVEGIARFHELVGIRHDHRQYPCRPGPHGPWPNGDRPPRFINERGWSTEPPTGEHCNGQGLEPYV